MFSFPSTKRILTSYNEEDREPLGLPKINHMEEGVADDEFGYLWSARGGKKERVENKGPHHACNHGVNTFKESQSSLPAQAGHERLRTSHQRAEYFTKSHPSLQSAPPIRNERSSSTMHSHYDPKTSPLAVSQQTSASSARDFATRKGRLSRVPALFTNTNESHRCDSVSQPAGKLRKKRPRRLDLSMLFPKPLPKFGPLLSPQRYTKSPAPLSASSDGPIKELRLQSFLCDTETNQAPEQGLPRSQDMHEGQRFVSSLRAEKDFQKPEPAKTNWFDDLRIDTSDDDESHPGPEMRASFIENAFQAMPGTVGWKTALCRELESEQNNFPESRECHEQPEGGKMAGSPRLKASSNTFLGETPCSRDGTANAALENSNLTYASSRSASTGFEGVNLHEESVFCSSSDEEEGASLSLQPRRSLKRETLLCYNRGVNAVSSDIEFAATKGVDTSFLHMASVKSRGFPSGQPPSTRSKSPTFGAVAIPERSSSKPGGSQIERHAVWAKLDSGILKVGSSDPPDHDSLSGEPSARAVSNLSRNESLPLMMALTPQEVALLEAMRSKKSLMRQPTPTEAHGDLVDRSLPSQSHLRQFTYAGHTGYPTAMDDRTSRLDGKSIETMRQFSSNVASREPSLPSGRASLIFSESLSSPTTGRDSPATPTLDSVQDVHILQSGGDHDGPSRALKESRPVFVNRRKGSNPTTVSDPFQPAQKESFGPEDCAWVFPGVAGRRILP